MRYSRDYMLTEIINKTRCLPTKEALPILDKAFRAPIDRLAGIFFAVCDFDQSEILEAASQNKISFDESGIDIS